MTTPSSVPSLCRLTKRVKLSNCSLTTTASHTVYRGFHHDRRGEAQATSNIVPSSDTNTQSPPVDSLSPQQLHDELRRIRLPRAVQATYLTPLRREATHGDTVCDLQLRSYSLRNLEVFADFALRAAYFLNLPAKGPIPLPRITERWTVPRSNFIFKKSQENFERVTTRRLIQIQDGNPETVQLWLAFLQKHRYYGLGMKANVFEHTSLDEAYQVDDAQNPELLNKDIQKEVESRMGLIGALSKAGLKRQRFEEAMQEEQFKGAWGGYTTPMASAQSTKGATRRARLRTVKGTPRVIKAKKVASVSDSGAESSSA